MSRYKCLLPALPLLAARGGDKPGIPTKPSGAAVCGPTDPATADACGILLLGLADATGARQNGFQDRLGTACGCMQTSTPEALAVALDGATPARSKYARGLYDAEANLFTAWTVGVFVPEP
jgi:hypothetical protein